MSPGHIREIGTRIASRYADLGGLSFAYAQGSLVEGLAEESDLDLVLVWTDAAPPVAVRPPSRLADENPPPETFDVPGLNLDRFFVGGQQIDAKHVTVDDVERWGREVSGGRGASGYPMPAIALHGLTNGLLLCDHEGLGASFVERSRVVPRAFVDAAGARAEKALPEFLDELDRCVARGDALLFHDQLVQLVRLLFIAWFARRGRWWPHEKRLTTRLRAIGCGDLADLEEAVWVGQLANRRAAVQHLSAALRD